MVGGILEKKINVCFVTNTLQTFGGGERWVLEVIKNLKNEFNIRIVNPVSKKSYIRIDKQKILESYGLKDHNVIDIRCHGVARKAFNQDNFILMIPSIKATYKLFDSIKKSDTVYIISFNPVLMFYTLFFSKIFRKKLIVGVHNPIFFKLFNRNTQIIYNIQNYFYRSLLKQVKFFHVLNTTDKNLIKENFVNAQTYLIPNFVTFDFKRIYLNKSKFIVLYVGRLDIQQKGIDLLCKIIETFPLDNKNIIFHIVGNGGDGEALIKSLIRHRNNIKWLNFISDKKLSREYAKANLFIFPSRYEGFPIALLEAQGYGLPAVVFNSRGVGNIIKSLKTGKVINNFDTHNASKAIISYYKTWRDEKKTYKHMKMFICNVINTKYNKGLIIPKLKKILS